MLKKFLTYFKKNKILVWNVIFQIDFNQEIDPQTLMCEVQFVAKDLNHAKEIAEEQINKINKNLGSRFYIYKLWVINQRVNLKKGGKPVSLKEWDENDFLIQNYNKNLSYLKEEFNYCKSKDHFLSVN